MSTGIAFSRSDIIDMSIDSLDEDQDYDECYYSFDDVDDNSSLTNDGDTFEPSSFSGSFRWADVTKFADDSPEVGPRKPLRRNRSSSLSTHSTGGPTAPPPPPPPFVDECPEAATRQPERQNHSSSRSTGSTCAAKPPPSPPSATASKLGRRISLLMNSPTNSPRSTITCYRNSQVVGRKTLKKVVKNDSTMIHDLTPRDESSENVWTV